MTWTTDENGLKIEYNYVLNRWEYEDGTPCINDKTICPKCNKPRLNINGVDNCDFCLQGLTTCDFIDYACCGHGNDNAAYISLKDGKLFTLSKWSIKETKTHVSAENQYKAFKEMNEKITKWHLREKTKILLSLPIPMSYEVWSKLHRYLERLE